MSYEPHDYLRHMLVEVDFLAARSRGIAFEVFLQDEALKRAFVRALEIIGEAVRKLPDDFRKKHPGIEWKAMAGMRDRLIHAYFGVDYEIVWDVVTRKIPTLKHQLETILGSQAP